jgi:hypothetical protein
LEGGAAGRGALREGPEGVRGASRAWERGRSGDGGGGGHRGGGGRGEDRGDGQGDERGDERGWNSEAAWVSSHSVGRRPVGQTVQGYFSKGNQAWMDATGAWGAGA